jgi:predicted DNA-binding transcriptional regulator AlpA
MKRKFYSADELRAIQAKKYINIDEFCALTGYSRQWVYGELYKARVLNEGIPYIKFGRAVRFDLEKVMYWLESRHETFRPMSEAIRVNYAKKYGRIKK